MNEITIFMRNTLAEHESSFLQRRETFGNACQAMLVPRVSRRSSAVSRRKRRVGSVIHF